MLTKLLQRCSDPKRRNGYEKDPAQRFPQGHGPCHRRPRVDRLRRLRCCQRFQRFQRTGFQQQCPVSLDTTGSGRGQSRPCRAPCDPVPDRGTEDRRLSFKAEYIPFDVRRELDGAHHCIHADSYRGNYFFSFYNEDDEEQSAKIFEYAIKDDRLTPVEEYNIGGSNALSIDRNGILYAMDTLDVYCYDLNSSDPEEPGDALDYSGSCYSSKDRDLTVIYWTNSAPVLVQDGEYTELILEGDNEIGPFCSMPSLNLSGDELLTVGELESSGDDYFAAFDLDGNELARSSQPVGSFDAVMMKRPNGYLLDTGYVWELYGPDGTFLEKSLPVGERETLCQLCGDFCTFDVFLPLEENAFLAVGHHGKATEPDEPVVFRITTDF